MQPNQPGPTPRRPSQRPRPAGIRPATPNIPRNDLPPGMGGDKHGYSPQAYQAQPGAPAQHTNAGYQQPYQQHAQYAPPPVQASGMNPKALGGIGIGALLIIVGIGATMYSYDSAADGGSYTIWWGPVLFGVITLIGGIAGLFKR